MCSVGVKTGREQSTAKEHERQKQNHLFSKRARADGKR